MRLYRPMLAVILLSLPIAAQARFRDISYDNPSWPAIDYLEQLDAASGYADGTFRPDVPVNRAELTKIVVSLLHTREKIDACVNGGQWGRVRGLEDVHWSDIQRDWFAPYVCIGVDTFIDGYADGTFRPERTVNFAEASKILVSAFLTDGRLREEQRADPWYKPYVERLGEANAIPESITRFDQPLSRAEMAEIIYRLRARIADRGSVTYEHLRASVLSSH